MDFTETKMFSCEEVTHSRCKGFILLTSVASPYLKCCIAIGELGQGLDAST